MAHGYGYGWRKTMTNDECPKMLYPFLHIILILCQLMLMTIVPAVNLHLFSPAFEITHT